MHEISGNLAMPQRLEHRDRLIAVGPVLVREDGMGYYALFYEVVDDFVERRNPRTSLPLSRNATPTCGTAW